MADYDAAHVTDSTDWLETSLPGLSAVESALLCRVCRDFYKTPMITTCLHTFCSLCIRRSLANDGRCPACRAPEQESKLRWNGALDEAVDAYVKTRPAVLSLARAGPQESRHSPKRKLEAEPSQDSEDLSRKRLRSSARLNRARGEETTAEIVRQEVDVIEDSADEEYEDNRDDKLAACPICNRQMKEFLVFGHLDKCTGPSTDAPQTSSREPPTPSNFLISSPRKQQTGLELLPALNYSTIKDQVLRKKMTDLGIPSTGPRVLLERRHREWRTIWNANCDAVRPRLRHQLVRDLDVWERTQGGRAPAASRLVPTPPMVRDKDFDGDAWATKYTSSFKDLVANARRSRPPKQEPDGAEGGQTEGEASAGVHSHKQEERDPPIGDAGIDGQQVPATHVGDVEHSHSAIDTPMDDSGVNEEKTQALDAPVGNAGSPDNNSVVDSHDQKVLQVPVNN